MEAAEVVAGFRSLLAHDAAGVGRVVAADIEEIADVMSAGAVEDLLAIGLVRLVAGRAEGRRRRAGQALEPIGGDRGEIDEPLAAGFDDAAHPMPHAENTFHVTGISEAGFQAFDNSGQRLVDHRGRPA